MADKLKIAVLERNSAGQQVDMSCFEQFGEVIFYGNTTTEEEVIERTADVDIVIANKSPMNERTLKNSKRLKLVCELATGFDNCDLKYLRSRGIPVTNVANYCTPMVAQHTFTLALALSQKLSHYDTYVKSGEYSAQDRFSNFDVPFHELNGKTWGIVGMGNIGRRVAAIAESFGCRVIFHSVTGKSTVTEYEQVDKDTLLAESDVLSLHCPLSDLTRNFIDAQALKKMKNTAVLINVARGPVVNNADLYEALMSGEIMAAGLDVVEKEPLQLSNPLSKIKDSDKLIITPHLAWGNIESLERLVNEVCLNIEAFLAGNERNVVN